MATIHLLPFEVIRHFLALAHPAGAPGACSGLRATALVHSTWTGPSKSVLLEHIRLRGRSEGSVERFLRDGPVGFSCQSLTLDSCDNAQLRAVLARANPGGIRRLSISNACEPLPADLFAAPSLRGKSSLAPHGVMHVVQLANISLWRCHSASRAPARGRGRFGPLVRR
jgi:hypothetical protein